MNREIKFRGKSTKTGEWVYGCLTSKTGSPRIAFYNSIGYWIEVEVIPESISQYTGINDMYSQEVYEGDILETKQCHTNKLIFTKVEFVEGAFVEKIVRDESERINRSFIPLDADCSKVIGNIFENPELLEELQNGTK